MSFTSTSQAAWHKRPYNVAIRFQNFDVCRFGFPAFAPTGLPLAGYLQRSRACGSAFLDFSVC